MSVNYQFEQGVATLTFDRPDKRNAITGAMYEALAGHLQQAAADGAVRAVLVTGAGVAFTAGNDLKDFGEPRFAEPNSPVIRFMQTLAAFEKPVVAAVNGMAVGIGVTMLLHCDLVYVADDATFSMPFVNLGLVPEFGSTLLLPAIAGRVRAAEMLLLGRPFLAAEAVVTFQQIGNFIAAIHDGGMVTPAERISNLREGDIRFLPEQVHGDLPREGNFTRTLAT